LSDAQITSVRVASAPTLPVNPVRPKKLLNLALALAAGIIGGLGLAFLIEYLDHGLKTPEDVEHYLAIPAVGSFFESRKADLDQSEVDRITSWLDVVNTEKPPQALLVASSVPGEKAAAVGKAIAQSYQLSSNERVIWVDCGDRAADPSGGSRPGVTNVLMGETALDDAIESGDGVDRMGAGTIEQNARYLFASQRMKEVMDDLRQRYGRVIVTGGPVLRSNALLDLGRQVDGAVVIVKADATRREVVQRAIEILREGRVPVLGAVLTDRKRFVPDLVYRHI